MIMDCLLLLDAKQLSPSKLVPSEICLGREHVFSSGMLFCLINLSHAKEKGNLREYVEQLKILYSKYVRSCLSMVSRNNVDKATPDGLN